MTTRLGSSASYPTVTISSRSYLMPLTGCRISARSIMLFLKILLPECPTIIINSLITKEEQVVITRLKKERERRRVRIYEQRLWLITIKRRTRRITSVKAALSAVRNVTLKIVIVQTTKPKSEQC